VVVAALATGFGALPLLAGFGEPALPTGALYGAGWPAFGVAAALLVDRAAEPRLCRSLALLAMIPAVMVALALATGDQPIWAHLEELWRAADVVIALFTLVVLAWAMGYTPGRTQRRRLFWLMVCSVVVLATVVAADSALEPRAQAVVLTLGMWSIAGLVARLTMSTEFRPVEEPLLDIALVTVTLAIGAAVGLVVRLVGARAGIPAPELTAAFAALVSSALTWPAVARWRRSWLAHRYGTGTLSSADVASITADLHRMRDPRELLAKAAEMVATASGQPDVTLLLGEGPDNQPGWVERPLLVAGDTVGTLMLRPHAPEGLEPRQARMIEQLLPTVALVCRAVGLAVEAEHARQDVARERDAERARILGDLHDGLGPVLAGMSMRVQAEVRRNATPLLSSLATDLAHARGDLRRIVSGLTPSALVDADLTAALQGLIVSFESDERHVDLETTVEQPLCPEVTVAVYRCVAEGITNAFRHGRANWVKVRVATYPGGQVIVDVRDDGVGGPIAPGVGLTSLRQRARQLGGTLEVGPSVGSGVLLHLELPIKGAP
jgi:signal transduction histidine kinase